MKLPLALLLPLALCSGCDESHVLRSAGSPCESADECESNLCYESLCVDAPGATPQEQGEGPLDCTPLCAHLLACDLSESETEQECVTWCEDNRQLLPPRLGSCAQSHLADGQCDEDAFGECADGPIIDFFERASTPVCERIMACCDAQESALFSDVSECVGLAAGLGGGFINASELMGYLSFDEAVAEACATKIEEVVPGTSCDTLPADIGPFLGDMVTCEGLITPLQGEGDPCGITLGEGYDKLPASCLDGLVCEANGDAMPTCEQGVPTGGDCSAEAAQCGGEGECIDGVCTEQLDQGEACATGQQCASGNCEADVCGAPSPLCGP